MDNYYPAAFIDNISISRGEFLRSYAIEFNYYGNSLKAAGENAVMMESDDVKNELKRAVLESLIEQKLVNKELENRIIKKDLDQMILNKIGSIDFNSEKFKKGADSLYGASGEEIKKLILIPKIKEEILEGRLILSAAADPQFAGLDEWLKEKKLAAKVVILEQGLSWDNGAVIIK